MATRPERAPETNISTVVYSANGEEAIDQGWLGNRAIASLRWTSNMRLLISIFHLVPSRLNMLIEEDAVKDIKTLGQYVYV